MRWLPLALLTALAFGGYNLLLKLASDRIDQVLGAFVLQAVAATAGGLALAAWWWAAPEPLRVSRPGLAFAAGAGVCVGAAEILALMVFARGAPVSLGTPVIMGGSALCTALLGIAVLREAITPSQALGVLLVTAGIALLSTGGH